MNVTPKMNTYFLSIILLINLFCLWHVFMVKSKNEVKQTILHFGTKIFILPQWDHSQLVNLSDFKLYIFNRVCNSSDILALVFVLTAPTNLDKREAIRASWGKKNVKIKIIFILGTTTEEIQDSIRMENEEHHDIIQGNFKDVYRNLTYKTVLGLKYATYYCQQAKYVIKLDDDVYFNTNQAIAYLENKYSKCGSQNLIQCRLRDNAPVDRNNSKWVVTIEEYPNKVYPQNCFGYAVIFSWEATFNLYKEAQKGDFFWIEDVYVTSILAERLPILTRKKFESLELNGSEMNKLLNGNITKNNTKFIVSPAFMQIPANMIKVWNIMENITWIYNETDC